jgi:hypothetical protein
MPKVILRLKSNSFDFYVASKSINDMLCGMEPKFKDPFIPTPLSRASMIKIIIW